MNAAPEGAGIRAASDPAEVFPLACMADLVRALAPPAGPFDPAGDRTLDFALHTIGQVGTNRAGSVRITRARREGGEVTLAVEYRKIYPGRATGLVEAEMTCRADALSTPIRWRHAYGSIDAAGARIPSTRIEKTGTVEGDAIVFSDARSVRRVPRPPAYTTNWALFDVIPRLPREPFDPIRFSLLDDFDEMKPDQVVSYRTAVDVRTKAGTLRLHGYDHLGRGIVPTVYWTDGAGRLLIVAAGIEAFLFEPRPAQGRAR
ncbi:MAG: hypothetical protein JXP34_08190 [Planctomycetes bacterium]|nr:hypothetical protein [Planctomycetota bacterium]